MAKQERGGAGGGLGGYSLTFLKTTVLPSRELNAHPSLCKRVAPNENNEPVSSVAPGQWVMSTTKFDIWN